MPKMYIRYIKRYKKTQGESIECKAGKLRFSDQILTKKREGKDL